MFCSGFDSSSIDLTFTQKDAEDYEMFKDALIDFRPYIIENPYTVVTTDYLQKCLDLFRKMHLRHLIVLHPADGQIKGILTRQDLFKWLDL